MPNRIIRESLLESEPVNELTVQAECFFYRLMLKADDFGRFTGHRLLLKSALFPLKPDVRESDISRWCAECAKAGVIALYQVSGKDYIVIPKFNQRTRAIDSKYPAPDDGCLTSGSQAAAAGLPPAHVVGDGDGDGDVGQTKAADEPPPASRADKAERKPPELTDDAYITELGADPAYRGMDVTTEAAKMARWCKANGKQPTRRRFINWLNRADRPLSLNGHAHPNGTNSRAPDRVATIPASFGPWFQAKYPAARITTTDAFDNPAYRKEFQAENKHA